jgi:glucose dehydrogenase
LVGGWWLVVGGWWLVVGGWWYFIATALAARSDTN